MFLCPKWYCAGFYSLDCSAQLCLVEYNVDTLSRVFFDFLLDYRSGFIFHYQCEYTMQKNIYSWQVLFNVQNRRFPVSVNMKLKGLVALQLFLRT